MKLEKIDIFYNNKFYSTEVIEKNSYEKVKKDIEQVWGLDSNKVELVCYDYDEHKKFDELKGIVKVIKGEKVTTISPNLELKIKAIYIK